MFVTLLVYIPSSRFIMSPFSASVIVLFSPPVVVFVILVSAAFTDVKAIKIDSNIIVGTKTFLSKLFFFFIIFSPPFYYLYMLL
ncbi:hypothetical protein MBCUT_03570 [Methanobrevibacter cuticularis]|uniref:Uncharacterized protein n=1 Tax=Methanobrevibacter cuticularis TaxID=47311 RepID=A0A166EXV4_9EURY|nr:hypothetical protein MBCUT_03570 [Methanobrevibacter cuticularis]